MMDTSFYLRGIYMYIRLPFLSFYVPVHSFWPPVASWDSTPLLEMSVTSLSHYPEQQTWNNAPSLSKQSYTIHTLCWCWHKSLVLPQPEWSWKNQRHFWKTLATTGPKCITHELIIQKCDMFKCHRSSEIPSKATGISGSMTHKVCIQFYMHKWLSPPTEFSLIVLMCDVSSHKVHFQSSVTLKCWLVSYCHAPIMQNSTDFMTLHQLYS